MPKPMTTEEADSLIYAHQRAVNSMTTLLLLAEQNGPIARVALDDAIDTARRARDVAHYALRAALTSSQPTEKQLDA